MSIYGDSDSKESTCNAGDLGSIPGLGRSPGGGHWQPTPIFLPGESPWTEVPGGLQSMGSKRVRHDWVTKHIYIFTTYRKLSCILSLILNLWSRQVSTVHSHEVFYFCILIHKSAGERLQRHTCPLPEACRCHKRRQDRIDSQILSARSLCPLKLACSGLSCLIL